MCCFIFSLPKYARISGCELEIFSLTDAWKSLVKKKKMWGNWTEPYFRPCAEVCCFYSVKEIIRLEMALIRVTVTSATENTTRRQRCCWYEEILVCQLWDYVLHLCVCVVRGVYRPASHGTTQSAEGFL